MTRALVPLSMTTIGLLPERCRGCVAWELDADGVRSAVRLGDTEFEKEVWLSGVMLTWGSAGQIVTVDDVPVGFALFAPPTAVPGATAFPTSPVSPDAVLLTTARIRDDFTGQGLARYLMNGVVNALTRRGVRAIEVFGREDTADQDATAATSSAATSSVATSSAATSSVVTSSAATSSAATSSAATSSTPASAEPVTEGIDAGLPRCLIPARFARAVGFEDVAKHHHYPRLRLELGRDIGWKAEVESALEKLFTVIQVPASPSPLVPELEPVR